MKKRASALALLGLFSAACQENTAPTQSDLASNQPEPDLSVLAAGQAIPNKYIVVLKTGQVSSAAVESQRLTRRHGGRIERTYEHALKGFSVELSPRQLAALRSDPAVDYIEQDAVVRIVGTQSPTPSWGLDRIDQRNLPLNNSYTFANSGADVHFYGLDSGIRKTHSEFSGRVGNGFTSINDGRGTSDCNGHGTHTASTAAGAIYGVAKAVTVHPVRVLDCSGSGSFAGVIQGIDWVTANRIRPAVANMSLGGNFHAATNQAVTNSIAAGVVYAISSGNSNANACNFSPASTPNALTVNASTINDARASFSNFGSCTDIFAPGVNIKAGWNTSNTATNTISGTSMAAPHVAGAAALYLAANPGATPAQVGNALISNATLNKITSPGSGSPNRLLFVGFIGGGGGGNQPPVAGFTYSCNGATQTCTYDGTSSTDDVGVVSYRWVDHRGVQISTAAIFTRHYDLVGTFNRTLTVTDGGGLSNSITKPVVQP